VKEVSILIGGEAGDGVKRSGLNLGKILMRSGLNVYVTDEYQSLIRGGHNFIVVRASNKQIFSQVSKINIIVAFNKETIQKHKEKLVRGGLVIYDEQLKIKKKDCPSGKLCPLPMKKMLQEKRLPDITKNSIALGAVMAALCLDIKPLEKMIKETIHSKINENISLAKAGYELMDSNNLCLGELKTNKPGDNILLSGSEAIALGAIKAGMKLYAAYPMTPASPILHYLAKVQRDAGIVVFQPESEIAAMNLISASSYAGVRSMTGTSGGGFALMSEAFGLAAMVETPVVVALAMRPGPSTGLATDTSQGDLRFALHASQDDFPRIVVAPGDFEECFYLTFDLFNLAEKFQVPAIVLVDKYLTESSQSIPEFNTKTMKVDRGKYYTTWKKKKYGRYQDTKDGVSPYVVPGTKGVVVKANSTAHDEFGFATQDGKIKTKMMDRYYRKIKGIKKEIGSKAIQVHGPKKAKITVIGWGSTKGPILESLEMCEENKIKANFIQVKFMSPFPTEKLKKVLSFSKKVLIVENNKTSQLGGLLKENLCFEPDSSLLKYDGRPFNPEQIFKKIKVMARGK
jgi:2-oxoglutarate ferredoxin oxidoreductase subunit alpha